MRLWLMGQAVKRNGGQARCECEHAERNGRHLRSHAACERPVPRSEPAADLGALGGTRTPNLLIRSSRHIVQDRPLWSVRWADIPQLSIRGWCCPPPWQQYWQQSPPGPAERRALNQRTTAMRTMNVTRPISALTLLPSSSRVHWSGAPTGATACAVRSLRASGKMRDDRAHASDAPDACASS